MTDIKRVLVANRGEIALRIIRACHEEGMEAVAVYSEVDRLSPHVRAADAAVALGPAPAAESYLDAAKLVAAARHSGCQALHPGYGFLSERAPFAEAVTEAELESAFEAAQSEALKAFGAGEVYLEKYLERPRHIEIQVLADSFGRVVSLGERECSIQRRHQKLIEEAPSLAVTPALRRRLSDAATAAAGAVGYLSAGTIEFLLAPSGEFYFLEMNTRLQVEHPVTELVYGVDIVREQLRVATGQPLRVHAGTLAPRGHAIECRIMAADPFTDFLPVTRLRRHLPAPGGDSVRRDAGFETGDEVTLHYDSLMAKLIAWGETRPVALERMRRALRELVIVGLPTSQPFHLRVMDDPEFQRGDLDITYLDRAGARLLSAEARPDLTRPLAAVAALPADRRGAAAPPPAPASPPTGRPSARGLVARRGALRGGGGAGTQRSPRS